MFRLDLVVSVPLLREGAFDFVSKILSTSDYCVYWIDFWVSWSLSIEFSPKPGDRLNLETASIDLLF